MRDQNNYDHRELDLKCLTCNLNSARELICRERENKLNNRYIRTVVTVSEGKMRGQT